MAGYSPLRIAGMQTGLVQEREEFLLPNDAYPVLQNAYVWRERILRKKGYELLGRLQRLFIDFPGGVTGASPWTFNLYSQIVPAITPETNAQIAPGTIQIEINPAALVGNIVAPGYTIASDAEVFTPSTVGLTTGDYVTIAGVVVVPGSGPDTINTAGPYRVEVFALSFKLGVDSHAWGTWQVAGTWTANVGNPITFIDQGDGTLTSTTPGNSGKIDYKTGNVTLIHTAGAGVALDLTFGYYPNLPVMGLRQRELQDSTNDEMIAFDQKYAYRFNEGFQQFEEFIPGTTWNAHGGNVFATDFFWSTNYWVSAPTVPATINPASPPQVLFTSSNVKLFWVTNNTGQYGALADPPRITDGTTWVAFTSSTWNQLDATNSLFNWLSMLPFRGRMVVFNTWEGPTASGPASAQQYSNRIRWSTIGNPFLRYDDGPPARGSWRDDIRGQGGFLDIPTSEDIVAVGFVRDNLVIYCERSTWQLRYTGRSIAPFQIERVNSELGAAGPFSAIQFDTSLLGFGDKGIVECDSYKSERIDIKIPDLVYKLQSDRNAVFRIQGIRDFINRLAFWTIPLDTNSNFYPDQRLVYNYENDSWALFNDSLTALGTYQPQDSRTWLNTPIPWIECDFAWIDQPEGIPAIVGGNQQGFVEYLDSLNTNDVSLYIKDITANTTQPTVITSPNHNMETGFVIEITNIPTGTPFDNLNDQVFGIILGDNLGADADNKFRLMKYNPLSNQFNIPQLDLPPTPPAIYLGTGLISIRENFSITSKKFNFLDEGQNIQLGYLDILMTASETDNSGAISMNVYLDYDDENASNILPQNQINNGNVPRIPDTFFNSIIPTSPSANAVAKEGTKFWQRVYCATRANFLTIEYTFSNAQLAGQEQEQNVQIDAQIIWIRKGGRLTQL